MAFNRMRSASFDCRQRIRRRYRRRILDCVTSAPRLFFYCCQCHQLCSFAGRCDLTRDCHRVDARLKNPLATRWCFVSQLWVILDPLKVWSLFRRSLDQNSTFSPCHIFLPHTSHSILLTFCLHVASYWFSFKTVTGKYRSQDTRPLSRALWGTSWHSPIAHEIILCPQRWRGSRWALCLHLANTGCGGMECNDLYYLCRTFERMNCTLHAFWFAIASSTHWLDVWTMGRRVFVGEPGLSLLAQRFNGYFERNRLTMGVLIYSCSMLALFRRLIIFLHVFDDRWIQLIEML